ncbi:hypothetical protein RB620_19305 [Paenibacillus sp. LHD-117]|uniref:hypothetical protein n=1 Tax=Paenibacillus sp. LHD-117 TaxID=3071412 RepID=UPI0027E163D1|nr:hypothetical protein [Paenibacillus sp. LHD-117]MDQ6421578.1 hypothetical protein [Paenibacillus sp. LHD-117]
MKKRAAIGLTIVMAFALLACSSEPRNAESKSYEERLLLNYVLREQSGEFGVYTNRLDTGQDAEAATGQEVLSESAGLLLRYYAARTERDAFRDAWTKAKATFDQPGGFSYRYAPRLDKRFAANAAVDDLRLIRALFEGASAFREPGYRKEAERYGRRFLEHNVKEGNLYDFYDARYKSTNGFLTLCYADFQTIGLLAESIPAARTLSDRLLRIVEGGYLSDGFPFYETRYEYEQQRYDSDGINMVESLLTVLALAEIGEQRDTSISALKEKVREGKLYGRYTKDGEPMNDVRSTALYAMAALIGREIGDGGLYRDALERMTEFQIQDRASALYGGFGDKATGDAYSFDNLMALLAYAAD